MKGGQDHPDIADIALAMGLVMPLLYSRDDLEAMLSDLIRQADPSHLWQGCRFRARIRVEKSRFDNPEAMP